MSGSATTAATRVNGSIMRFFGKTLRAVGAGIDGLGASLQGESGYQERRE